jgi:hypothetical protein
MENHSLLSFFPHTFHFPSPPEPPSTCHHVVDEELEEAQEGVDHQDVNRRIPLPLPSHHQHHTIDDRLCKAFA